MKRGFSILILTLALSAIFVGGCGATAVPPTATPKPTNTAQPTSAPTRDVVHEGISFSYDASLASDVMIETTPPMELLDGGGGILPEHVEFSFDGYILPDSSHRPYIQVYPLSGLDPAVDDAWTIAERLKQLLAERPEGMPEAASSLPVLPLLGARQEMNAQIKYVDFENGMGVRFLTQFAHGTANVPIHNRGMVFSFQGTTADGRYYVAALLPVSHPVLPATAADAAEESYRDGFPAYIGRTEQQLNTQNDASFFPDLTLLDAMIASLSVHPTSLPSVSK